MDLTSLFSDDQLAIMGCFLALAVCGGVAALSFRFGAAQDAGSDETVSFPARADQDTGSDAPRKAA